MSGDCSSDTTAILLQKVVNHEKFQRNNMVNGNMVNGNNNKICAQTGCCSWAAKICSIQALTAHQSELPERMNKQVAMVLGQDDVKVSCQI